MVPCTPAEAAATCLGRGDARPSPFTCTFGLEVAPHQAEALECRQRARRMREMTEGWAQEGPSADPGVWEQMLALRGGLFSHGL